MKKCNQCVVLARTIVCNIPSCDNYDGVKGDYGLPFPLPFCIKCRDEQGNPLAGSIIDIVIDRFPMEDDDPQCEALVADNGPGGCEHDYYICSREEDHDGPCVAYCDPDEPLIVFESA